MRAARLLVLLLALLLLVGCAAQRTPAATPEPEPTPEPTPEETLEPEPCRHPSWEDGVCSSCGYRCPHYLHELETKRCLECGKIVPHSFQMGFCSRCGVEPSFVTDRIPREIFQPCEHAGTVEMLSYTTADYRSGPYGEPPGTIEKQMAVYLPYGYDPSQPYDVLVLLHGISGSERTWLVNPQDYSYPQNDNVLTVNMLDNRIEAVDCRPMIVVGPTFYRDSSNPGDYMRYPDQTCFTRELREVILPLIIERYSTFAADGSPEAIAAAREHFAFAGLSQGSIYVYTSILPDCLDLFAWFGAFSGSDGDMPQLAAELNTPPQREWPIYCFYNGIGTSDVFYTLQWNQYHDLIWRADPLIDGVNAYFHSYEGLGHSYAAWGLALYNFLPLLFSTTIP